MMYPTFSNADVYATPATRAQDRQLERDLADIERQCAAFNQLCGPVTSNFAWVESWKDQHGSAELSLVLAGYKIN